MGRARTKAELLDHIDRLESLALRLAVRTEHDPLCDAVCEPNENSCCTCGLEDLDNELTALGHEARRDETCTTKRRRQ